MKEKKVSFRKSILKTQNLRSMNQFKCIAITFILSMNWMYSQNFDIRLMLTSIDCQTRIACYDVQLRSTSGSTWNLAGQNYRIFYNSALASYNSGSGQSLLPAGTYGNFELVQNIQHVDASAINGPLSFEADLGFLNFFIDLNNLTTGAIPIDGNWTSTANICFTVEQSVIDGTSDCLEIVWARSSLTSDYATAFVEVSRWVGPNNTISIVGQNYLDLNSGSGDAACFDQSCPVNQSMISIADLSVNENAGTATMNICLDQLAPQDVSVTVITANNSAVAPSDYTTVNTTVTIPAGSLCTSVNVPIIDDVLVEGTETFFVNLSNPINAGITDNQGVVTILDNDVSNISIGDITVNENAGSALLTICIDNLNTQNVSVNLATANNSAVAPGDYTSVNTIVTIPAGSLCTSVNVPIINDVLVEVTETFFANLSNPINGSIADNQGVVTILDNDVSGISIGDVTVNENAGTALLTICIDQINIQNVSVNVTTANNTANAPGDYTSVNTVVTIPAGSLCTTVNVPIINDVLVEGTETFFANLSNPINASIADNQGVVTILDNDVSGISIGDVTVNENAGTALLTICIDNLNTQNVSVNVITANNSATAPSDYTTVNTIVTIPAGSLCTTVNVPIIDDVLVEGTETFFVNLSNPINGSLLDNQGVVTILDNDVSAISIGDVTVNENAGTAILNICIDKINTQNVSVNVITANNSATAPGDYTTVNTIITIPAGSLCATVNVPIINDVLVEGTETFFVNLSNPINGTIADNQGVVTILDNDASGISIGDVTVNESAGTALLTICIDQLNIQNVSVSVITANNSATAPGDYTSVNTVVTIPAGSLCTTLNVPIINDVLVEGTETFFANLSNPINASIADNQGVVTILDNDVSAISIGDVTVNENAGTALLNICIDKLNTQNVSVNVITANSSAIAPGDYTSVSTSVTIPAGSLCTTINVPIINDVLVEGTEAFFVNLSNPINGNILDNQGVVTILDNDVSAISIGDVTVNENAGTALLTICIDKLNTQNVSVNVTTANNTAIAPGDYTSVNTVVTIPAGSLCTTVNVPIVEDALVEGSEIFLVNLSNPINGSITDNQGVVTILDNDVVQTPNEFDIRFSLADIDCQAGQACYNVQIKSGDNRIWNLAGQNYRIYYNSALAQFNNGTSNLVQPTYSGFNLVQNLQHVDASATNGPLSFENDLGFVNYYMDLNNLNAGGILVGANWITTSTLCFDVDFEFLDEIDECLEFVWARDGLTNDYATAFVEVSEWMGPMTLQSVTGNVYDDLDDQDGNAACLGNACNGTVVGNRVFIDLNGNGIQDLGENGAPGVHVYLHSCSTGAQIAKDTTDGIGNYSFDQIINSGNYFIRFDLAPSIYNAYGFTLKNQGGNSSLDSDANPNGITDCFLVNIGESRDDIDAGIVQLARFGDFVWHDRNGNGTQEIGEEGIGGITVTLINANTHLPVRVTTTAANGLYLIDNVFPGNYYIKFDFNQTIWQLTTPNVGSDLSDSDVDGSNGLRTTSTTFLSPGEDDRTWDLGLIKCAMISGRVFYDNDKDGIFDIQETGINGLKVFLVNAMTHAVVSSLITAVNPATPSDDGYYKFACVKPGMYYVRFERPGHLAASDPYKGGNVDKDSDISHENGVNSSRKLTLLSGDMILNIGAGFQDKSTVGDMVWLDRNNNGLQDPGEPPVQGVIVDAYSLSGSKVSESTSGLDGSYMLDGISGGDYFVKFTPPVQYGFTRPKAGPETIDSDVTGTHGFGTTRVYRLLTGDRLPYIDAGLVAGVLPLEWLGFDGIYNGRFTELEWSTGVEINNSHFVIERRHESESSFVEIAQVSASLEASSSIHNYTYDDHNVVKSGVYYYKLKQVDHNASYTYSNTISISVQSAKGLGVEIYPNPVDDLLKVDLWLNEDSQLEVTVYDENGKNVLTQPFGGWRLAGKYSENLRTELLMSGQYNLQIRTSSGIVNKKFTVAR